MKNTALGTYIALSLSHRKLNNLKVTSTLRGSTFGLSVSLDSANDYIRSISPELCPITTEEWDYSESVVEQNHQAEVKMYCLCDDDYPEFLRVIKSPPPILYLKGNDEILKSLPGVAVVGTRKASEAGTKIAHRIASFLAEEGWVIVSGLALGIDAAAHSGALVAKGKTIAVLAHGLHKASPKANSSLGEEILSSGGAWVSEHPVGVEPRRDFFVPRNRIQIGLSAGSIIVEAEIKSGSTTQAQFCVGQNRALFAVVPHNQENSLNLVCNGTEMLVKEMGAIGVRTKDDYPKVLEILKFEQSKLTMKF